MSELEQYQNSIKEFNEHTRLEFENFIQTNGSDRNKLQLRCTPFTDKKGGYGSFDLDFGLSVYQHQQSKVDELQKRVDDVIQKSKEFIQFSKNNADIFEDEYEAGKAYGAEAVIELLEQALKGGSTPSLNTDENGECRHFSTTMFADSKAECFHCDAVVNEKREVIGKQSKRLNQFFTKTFSKEPK